MFESERLIYREMTDQDKDAFYEIFSSDKVDKFVRKMSYEEVERYFEKRKTKPKNPYSFAVVLKENNKMIGTVGLKTKEDGVGVVSAVFNDKYWNQGFCSESMKFLFGKAFEDWNFSAIKGDCQFDNVASNRILQKFHFKYLYSTDDNISHKTHKPVKFNFYELTREDYKKNKEN